MVVCLQNSNLVEDNLYEGSDNAIVSDCENNNEVLSEVSDEVHLSELSEDEEMSASHECKDDRLRGACIKGKSVYRWSLEPPSQSRTGQRNIAVRIPGNTGLWRMRLRLPVGLTSSSHPLLMGKVLGHLTINYDPREGRAQQYQWCWRLLLRVSFT
ncbi:hypothetical protein J6590_091042 [Homalodisca vitripennis]|nr:hypothetical protein J6590_091042 [Homalodisca vitripennis]